MVVLTIIGILLGQDQICLTVDFTFGGSVSAGWTPIYLPTSGASSFIGAGNSTSITITGATITIT